MTAGTEGQPVLLMSSNDLTFSLCVVRLLSLCCGAALYLILFDELLVGYVGRQVGMKKSTEGQAIAPAAAEVGHVNIL